MFISLMLFNELEFDQKSLQYNNIVLFKLNDLIFGVFLIFLGHAVFYIVENTYIQVCVCIYTLV